MLIARESRGTAVSCCRATIQQYDDDDDGGLLPECHLFYLLRQLRIIQPLSFHSYRAGRKLKLVTGST
jgi:hypothetical protein